MSKVRVRRMTQLEFNDWQTAIPIAYAEEQLVAGWQSANDAVQQALDQNALFLPQG